MYRTVDSRKGCNMQDQSFFFFFFLQLQKKIFSERRSNEVSKLPASFVFSVNNEVFDQKSQLSHHMGKPTICIGENKGADQLRSNCEADQRLCFRYSDGTIPLLLKSEISSF